MYTYDLSGASDISILFVDGLYLQLKTCGKSFTEATPSKLTSSTSVNSTTTRFVTGPVNPGLFIKRNQKKLIDHEKFKTNHIK